MKVKTQKYVLNVVFLLAIALLLALLGLLAIQIWSFSDENTGTGNFGILTYKIAISIVLLWFAILFPYLAWAVYFYNINQGRTNEEWEKINNDTVPSINAKEVENPYKNQTFGLPKGTIRGSLAITLMVSALAMFVVAMGQPDILSTNQFFHENYEFLKTAFLMMIAFYFGAKSLEYLRERWPNDKNVDTKMPGTGEPGITQSSEPITRESTPMGSSLGQYEDKEEDLVALMRNDMKAELTQEDAPEANEKPVKVRKQEDDDDISLFLTDQQIEKAAIKNELELALVKAVIKVESNGRGFLSDGRPKILFEGHKFWSYLKNKGQYSDAEMRELASKHPNILHKTPDRSQYKGGAAEHDRLNAAKAIDEGSALKSASYGLFQIMGFNHGVAGHKKLENFIDAMYTSEEKHLEAFFEFCKSNRLIKHLQNKDWHNFARGYNGAAYAKHGYHEKLERAYNQFSGVDSENVRLLLIRDTQNEAQTLGRLQIVVSETGRVIWECKSLELAWKDNMRGKSRIPGPNYGGQLYPKGHYKVVKRETSTRPLHFHITNVQNRSLILIHIGNFYTDIEGCILPGLEYADIAYKGHEKDGLPDVTSSSKALDIMLKNLPHRFTMEVNEDNLKDVTNMANGTD